MIMGLGGARSSWRYQTRCFKKYYRVLTFDNRGVGKSDKPTGPYTIKIMADDTLGLMVHLGIEKAHVLGVDLDPGGLAKFKGEVGKHGTTYPDLTWEPKESFRAVADYFSKN
jgi:pimeloyl-ACP methyl ester carboxylesterase